MEVEEAQRSVQKRAEHSLAISELNSTNLQVSLTVLALL